jgi:hypothetical protein
MTDRPKPKEMTAGEEDTLMACLAGVDPSEIRQYAYVIHAIDKGGAISVYIASRCSHRQCTLDVLTGAALLTANASIADSESE